MGYFTPTAVPPIVSDVAALELCSFVPVARLSFYSADKRAVTLSRIPP